MLINGARVSDIQRVSILAASVKSLPEDNDWFSDTNFAVVQSNNENTSDDSTKPDESSDPVSSTVQGAVDSSSTSPVKTDAAPQKCTPLLTSEYLTHIKYSSVASVLRQAVTVSTPSRHGGGTTATAVNANTNNNHRNRIRNRLHVRKTGGRMSPEELLKAKMTNPCRVCQMLGHWADAHNQDGSLKPGTLCIDPSTIKQPPVSVHTGSVASQSSVSSIKNSGNNRRQAPAIGFMANACDIESSSSNTVICMSTATSSSLIGPVVDDGAPFSAIGYT